MQAVAGQPPQLQGNQSEVSEVFDEPSRHAMSSAVSKRLSRSSSNHRASNSMRVSKPNSASNSPQAPWGNRRRTLMHDTASSRRTQQVLEQLLTPQDVGQYQQPAKRSSRPVSWHPGSYMQQQPVSFMSQPEQQVFSSQTYFTSQQTSPYYSHMSPGMMACSATTSPASAFSPLPVQYQGLAAHNTHYLPSDAWQAVQKSTPFYPTPNEPRDYAEPFPVFGTDVQLYPSTTTEGADWQNYIMHGPNTTTPPTPESLMQPEPAPPSMPQESPAFQTLDEPEDGEVLVGMGLYDAPEKVNEDPQLDNYKSTVHSLLGSRFRPCEPQGKGLKLEETWSPPPKSEDEEDDEDEEDEEEAETATKATAAA